MKNSTLFKKALASSFFLILVSSNIVAEEIFSDKVNQENVTSQTIETDHNELTSAQASAPINTNIIEEWFENFALDYGISYGAPRNGRAFYTGTSIVQISSKDADYAKDIPLMYEKAMFNMQSNMVLDIYGDLVSKKMMEIFQDDSTNANEFNPIDNVMSEEEFNEAKSTGDFSRIFEKALQVAEGKLDEILQQQGVRKKTESMSVSQKKLLLKDSITREIAAGATGSITGLVPIQTKIATETNDKGSFVKIGIIGVISDKTRQFAKDLGKQASTKVSGSAIESLRDILPESNNQYLNEVGLRMVYDQNGKPMLVSYGRWGVKHESNDPARYARQINLAKEKAELQAKAYISEFANLSVQVSQNLDVGASASSEIEKITEAIDSDNKSAEEKRTDIVEIIDVYTKEARAKSKLKMKGMGKVKTWEAKDENGIVHVGTVVTWSYDQLSNANDIASGNLRSKPKEIQRTKSEPAAGVNRESKSVNTLDDF